MDWVILHPILDWYAGPVLVVWFFVLLVLEHRRPLRRWVQGIGKRLWPNFGVGFGAMLALRLVLVPAVVAAAHVASREGIGLLHLVELPAWLHGVLAFLMLDYVLYAWHVLTHRVPWLWRFHVVHHNDLDLGLTTALRFHAGEMLASAVFRAAGVLAIGATPVAVLVYEAVFQASVAFHHSNLRVPKRVDDVLSRFVVTPRMHGIHHSDVQDETDSNFSNFLTIWDRLHRTFRLDVPQHAITIGVPGYRAPSDLTLRGLLTLPFRHPKPSWP